MDIQITMRWSLMVVIVLVFSIVQAQTHSYQQAYESYLQSIEKPIAEAQSRLSYVKDFFLNHVKEESKVYVIVIIRDESWRWEQVYLRVLVWEDDVIGGQLVSVMSVVSGYPKGAKFVIDQDRVVDWLIIHVDGREEGNFVLASLQE